MSEYAVNFIKYPVENIDGHKVQAIAQLYYGWLQGYKIIIDGKKFPQKLGHHYTELNVDQAIKDGLKDFEAAK